MQHGLLPAISLEINDYVFLIIIEFTSDLVA